MSGRPGSIVASAPRDNAPEETTLRVQGLPTQDNRWAVQCLNCDALLHGPFCSSCGQRAVPPQPTVRELAGDTFAELSGWDGKFAETVRTLFRKPGELTRQWIRGKRVHFISPWRLYLTASLLYFAVTATTPDIRGDGGSGPKIGIITTDERPSAADRVAERTTRTLNTGEALTGAERDSALAEIARAPAFMQPMMRRAIDEPNAFESAVRRAMPNVFLGLIPVLGAIVGIFYRGRNYPQHLYFAVHLASFVFIARSIGNLALYSRSLPIAAAVQGAILLWIVAYGVIALRRVYGGSVLATILKGMGIVLLYAIVAAPVIAAVAVLAAS